MCVLFSKQLPIYEQSFGFQFSPTTENGATNCRLSDLTKDTLKIIT